MCSCRNRSRSPVATFAGKGITVTRRKIMAFNTRNSSDRIFETAGEHSPGPHTGADIVARSRRLPPTYIDSGADIFARSRRLPPTYVDSGADIVERSRRLQPIDINSHATAKFHVNHNPLAVSWQQCRHCKHPTMAKAHALSVALAGRDRQRRVKCRSRRCD
jgi:hypothetical protein